MESKAKYFFVGITVSVLIVLTIAFILWASSLGESQKLKHYTVYFKEQGLSGLQVDSNVTMKGIKVGSVAKFSILPSDVERVKVILKLDEKTPVKIDTKAVIKRNLLTGLANIELTDTSNESPLLIAIMPGEEFAVIPEGKTQLDQIANTVPGLINDLGEVAQRIKAVVSDENITNVSATINHLERFSAFLSANADTFDNTVKNLQKLSEDGQKMVSSLEKLTKEANNKLPQSVEELNTALEQISVTAKTLEQSSKLVSSSVAQGVNQLVFELSNLSKDLEVAAQAFANAMDQFENPRSIITGPAQGALGPGETSKGVRK